VVAVVTEVGVVGAASTAVVVEAVDSTEAVGVAALITAEEGAALLVVGLMAALVAARIITPARPIIIPVPLPGPTAQWAAAPATAIAPAIARA